MQADQLSRVGGQEFINITTFSAVSATTPCPVEDLILKRINYYSRLRKVMSYLNEHTTEQIDLCQAAQIACMEKTSFSRFFRRVVGITFRDFLQRWRIAIAVEQIVSSDGSITEVAYSTGFESVSAFERTFKKVTTLNPSQYRKQILKNPRLAAKKR